MPPEPGPADDVEVLGDLPGGWRLERARGTVADLHAAELPPVRVLRICEATDAAVVLGSTQRADLLDAVAVGHARLATVRRRSGGGAVLLRPGEHLWVDVLVPVGDRLWDDDVERAAWWVGEWWASAIGASATVHRAPLTDRPAGAVACFAAVGPGEVLDADGRKLVGVSQRRNRFGARFQTLAYRRWDPGALTGLLADRAAADLVDPLLRAGVGAVDDRVDLVARLVAEVPP